MLDDAGVPILRGLPRLQQAFRAYDWTAPASIIILLPAILTFERYSVKTLIALLGSLVLSLPAYAADNACMSQAAEKKLFGAAQNSFIRNCVRHGCEAASAEKKLAGAAKTSFAKRCVAEGLQPYCEKQATGKKLSGAARTSFMNKCQTVN